MTNLEMLNIGKVNQLRREMGVSKKDLSERLGLSLSFGYLMLKNGALPENLPRRKVVLEKLAKLLGVSVSDILLRLEVREKEPA